MTQNFDFWCPLEISKAIDPITGEDVMRLGGIASTSDEDSDGEFLDPKGFDIKPLLSKGMVNWHHQAKGQPTAIIGEPTKAEIRPEGLYIETDLYPSSQIARDVYDLAVTMEKDSKTRRLGYSIEGKVMKRKSNDKKSLDYNVITKAVITGVAVTYAPKNARTFASIIKGQGCDEEVEEETEEEKEEKAMDTTTGAAVIKESLDKKLKTTTFSKAEVLERLFYDIPSISIEKAEKIYNLLLKLANMNQRKRITNEDILKAEEALGLSVEEVIEKSEGKEAEEETEETKEDETEETVEKAKEGTEEHEAEETPEEEEEEEEKEVKKGGENRFDRIEKAIAQSHIQMKNYIKASAVLIQNASEKLDTAADREIELLDIIKAQDETINGLNETVGGLSERIEMFGSQTPAPKSIRHAAPVERSFGKGEEDGDIQKANMGNRFLSMSKHRSQVLDFLDTATFAKGFDDEFSKACTHFEAMKTLPANIISRIKNEFKIDIVK